jgi:hypothetical protein
MKNLPTCTGTSSMIPSGNRTEASAKCATLFHALLTAVGRWDAEKGHS